MKEENERYKRWQESQAKESAYWLEKTTQLGYSRDYDYGESEFLAHRFSRFPVRDFRGKAVLEVGGSVFGPIHYIARGAAFKVVVDPLLGGLFTEFPAQDIYHIQGVGEHLPFETGSFDIVICHNVLDHVVDPRMVLSEIRRVLRLDGMLLLCVNTLARIALLAARPIIAYLDSTHPHHFSYARVCKMVSRSGLQIVDCRKTRGFDSPRQLSELFLCRVRERRFKFLLAYPLLETTYVTARKPSPS